MQLSDSLYLTNLAKATKHVPNKIHFQPQSYRYSIASFLIYSRTAFEYCYVGRVYLWNRMDVGVCLDTCRL